jgi:hypothetical protein
VDALASEMQDQVAQVRAALAQARAQQDDYLVDIHQAELEGLTRVADAHGLHVESDSEVIDLTAPRQESTRIA